MNCDDLLGMLNEYVDGSPEAELSKEFEEFSRHLRGCQACQVVVDNIRNTIQLYKGGQEYEMPAELRTKLFSAIEQKWQEKMGKAQS